ncbi:zinc-ribbon domain-containing protein [Aquiluna sp.]|nr:zinc-ribbon domain-containing protein [Aquiluna sp.]
MRTTHPALAEEFHPFLNGEYSPNSIVAGTSRKIWWNCSLGHEWRTSGNSRVTSNSGCPVCSNKKVLFGYNDLATTAPEIAKQWHATLNGDLLPTDVTAGSNKKVWWVCSLGHPWQVAVDYRTRQIRPQGCGVCGGKVVITGVNDLATIRPDLGAEWDFTKNLEIEPTQVSANSKKKAWWKCSEGHEWEASISNRNSRNSQCPGCATGGYDSTQVGIIYLIGNRQLRARKVGITNLTTRNNRMTNWVRGGWDVLATFESENGRAILDTETAILNWIRHELHLPPFLSRSDMGAMAGWSETFSSEGPSDAEVKNKIQEVLSENSKGEK